MSLVVFMPNITTNHAITYTNTVRSSLNLAHVIDGILARVPHEIARYDARVSKKKKKKKKRGEEGRG